MAVNSSADQSPAYCTGCGYDLRSLPLEGGCPECGAPIIASVAIASVDGRWSPRMTNATLVWLAVGPMIAALFLWYAIGGWVGTFFRFSGSSTYPIFSLCIGTVNFAIVAAIFSALARRTGRLCRIIRPERTEAGSLRLITILRRLMRIATWSFVGVTAVVSAWWLYEPRLSHWLVDCTVLGIIVISALLMPAMYQGIVAALGCALSACHPTHWDDALLMILGATRWLFTAGWFVFLSVLVFGEVIWPVLGVFRQEYIILIASLFAMPLGLVLTSVSFAWWLLRLWRATDASV